MVRLLVYLPMNTDSVMQRVFENTCKLSHLIARVHLPMVRYLIISDDDWDAVVAWFSDPFHGYWALPDEDNDLTEPLWVKQGPMHDQKLAEEGINNVLVAGIPQVARRTFRLVCSYCGKPVDPQSIRPRLQADEPVGPGISFMHQLCIERKYGI